jgi:O-antigen/teichoic acid export membrane protein
MHMGYFKVAFKGLGYQTILRVSIRIIGFVKIALIARMLGPAELGIFGIASLILSLLETLTDTGINVFLIQQNKNYKKYLNSAFLISIARGLIIAGVIVLSGPLIRIFFNIESTTYVLVLVSIVAILRGLVNPAIVKLEKEMFFDKELILRLFLYVVDTIFALYFTFKYQRAEGILIGMIIGVILEVLISWLFINPKPKIILNKKDVKFVLLRGRWVTLTGIFNYLFHNIDDIIVGKLLGIYSLGIYQLAYKLSTVPIYETGEIFGRVTFPIYTKISNDRVRLKRAFKKVTLTISLLVIPAGLILIIFANSIVSIVLGNKWIEAVPVIKLLAVFGILRSISASVTPLLYSIKKQAYAMNIMLLGLCSLILTIIPSIKYYGLNGAALSIIIATIFTLPLIYYYLKKKIFV